MGLIVIPAGMWDRNAIVTQLTAVITQMQLILPLNIRQYLHNCYLQHNPLDGASAVQMYCRFVSKQRRLFTVTVACSNTGTV